MRRRVKKERGKRGKGDRGKKRSTEDERNKLKGVMERGERTKTSD